MPLSWGKAMRGRLWYAEVRVLKLGVILLGRATRLKPKSSSQAIQSANKFEDQAGSHLAEGSREYLQLSRHLYNRADTQLIALVIVDGEDPFTQPRNRLTVGSWMEPMREAPQSG